MISLDDTWPWDHNNDDDDDDVEDDDNDYDIDDDGYDDEDENDDAEDNDDDDTCILKSNNNKINSGKNDHVKYSLKKNVFKLVLIQDNNSIIMIMIVNECSMDFKHFPQFKP